MPMAAHIGGIQRVSCVLAKEMLRQGHAVRFLCSSREEQITESEYAALHHYIPINFENLESSIIAYQKLLKDYYIDCAIFQWVEKGTVVWLKNTPKDVKTIATIHQQPFAGYGYERLMNKHQRIQNIRHRITHNIYMLFPSILRNKLKRYQIEYYKDINQEADITCLLSKRYIQRIIRMCPSLDENRLRGINNPLTFELIDNIDFANKENIILFVGRIENTSKNIFGFLDIWNKLSKTNPNWKAIVAGDGSDLPFVKQYVLKKKIDRVEFPGNCKDVGSLYKRAKVLAVTSFGEGFPMVLTEGMSYGCVPIVFNSYEAVYDIVDHEKSGFIVPAFDYNQYVKYVQSLISNNTILEEMAKAAMEKVTIFSPENIVPQWMELINSIGK